MSSIDDILDYWLNTVGPDGWYCVDAAIDQTVRHRFMRAWEQAETLATDWQASPRGALAALILTDQFPRNMFRGDARAFQTDPLARRIADAALAAGHDMATPPPQRQFFYLPFEHSEDLADQDRAVALFTERMPGETLLHAHCHRDTIAAFGRFPWRNEALGRVSTAAEQRVLAGGGYGALVRGTLSLAAPG